MKPTILFLFGVVAVIFLPQVFMQGMFSDGIIYASVAKELSTNHEFWQFDFVYPAERGFYGHPPLHYWLGGFCFDIIGDHFFTERIFCFLILISTLLCLIKIFKNLGLTKMMSVLMPVLFLVFPLSYWGQMQNLLEPLLSLFCLFSIYFLIPRETSFWSHVLLAACAGLAIFCALLTKGVVSLFPIAFPLIVAIVFRGNWRVTIAQIICLLGVLSIGIAFLWGYDPSHLFFERYLEAQLIPALAGEIHSAPSQWHVLERLLSEELIIYIPLILIAIIKWKSLLKLPKSNVKWAIVFFLVGLSASLPILISPKQSGIYLIPALPYFVISASLIYAPLLAGFINRKNVRVAFSVIGIVGVLCGVSFTILNYGNFQRDEKTIQGIDQIGPIIPESSVVYNSDIYLDFGTAAYFKRRWDINVALDPSGELRPRLERNGKHHFVLLVD